MTRSDESMVPAPAGLTDEFPDGVPVWMVSLPVDEIRLRMEQRREGFTTLGFDPAEDYLDREHLH